MSVETTSYGGAISVYIWDAHPLQKCWPPCGLAGVSGECHKVWLPPSAKGTDLLPALRTNPLPQVSPGMSSWRKNKTKQNKTEGWGAGVVGPESEPEKQGQAIKAKPTWSQALDRWAYVKAL